MVTESSNEIKPKSKAPAPMTIGFFENTPDLELTNDVFGKDAFFS